jgi:hypothetical protein
VTEVEFRTRFDEDRRNGELTFVENADTLGIALGLNGPDTIVLFGGGEIKMAEARFADAPTPYFGDPQ